MTRRAVLAGMAGLAAWRVRGAGPAASSRLPPGVVPDVGCWFWTDQEFTGDGWRVYLDQVAAHAPFGLLTTSLRQPAVELTDDAVRERIGAAAAYAARLGIGLVVDLDVRLARRAYQRAVPDGLAGMVRCVELSLDGDQPVVCRVGPRELGDHYTFRAEPYLALSGRVARVWRYRRDAGGPIDGTVEPWLAACDVRAEGAAGVELALPPAPGWHACVAAWFEHLAPDPFAAGLDAFQRDLVARYAGLGLAGACKDEWGFPPDFDDLPARHDLWYSPAYDAAYRAATGGRSLLDDALLLACGRVGAERDAAIGAYMRLGLERHVAHEAAFYRDVKELLGAEAVVATHATWFPWPGRQEAKKNGLDWWQVPRDWAQTDEVTPLAARTALSKTRRDGVWINMFYAPEVDPYAREVWSAALAGGRVNVHPLWPVGDLRAGREALLRSELTRALCRVRLLNFITRAPLDCRVAVVFGHQRYLNWSREGFGDAGMAYAAALWRRGRPADLIPSSEAGERLRAEGGALWYGVQRYDAVVVYRTEQEPLALPALLARSHETRAWSVTDATDPDSLAEEVGAELARRGLPAVTASVVTPGWGGVAHVAPPLRGEGRLIDGTTILVRAERQTAGDPFTETLTVGGTALSIEAAGLAAVRLDHAGRLEALATGGLRRFVGGGLDVTLPAPIDVALWRDATGWHGVLQDWPGPPPPALEALGAEWRRLAVPPALPRE